MDGPFTPPTPGSLIKKKTGILASLPPAFFEFFLLRYQNKNRKIKNFREVRGRHSNKKRLITLRTSLKGTF
jgi:hypothetical protein